MSTSVKSRLFLITSVLCLVTMGGGGYLYARALASRHVYRTVPVTRGSLASAVSATGTLNAVITVQVGSQVSGQVKEMFVDFNSTVSKGQVIARINPDLFEAQVNQAEAQLDRAEAMVLNQQAVIEKTRADLESSRAALAPAHAQTLKSQVAVMDGKRKVGRASADVAWGRNGAVTLFVTDMEDPPRFQNGMPRPYPVSVFANPIAAWDANADTSSRWPSW